MRGLSFPELAFAVISRYVSEEDIPHADLKSIIDRSYSTFRSAGACSSSIANTHTYMAWLGGGGPHVVFDPTIYATTDVSPVRQFGDAWVLELFHGPTFAFKVGALLKL